MNKENKIPYVTTYIIKPFQPQCKKYHYFTKCFVQKIKGFAKRLHNKPGVHSCNSIRACTGLRTPFKSSDVTNFILSIFSTPSSSNLSKTASNFASSK